MNIYVHKIIPSLVVLVGVACIAPLFCDAQQAPAGEFKTLDNPGGGQVVYGPVANDTSLGEAMGQMLRSVHRRFAERPTAVSFVRALDGHSIAAFFTVTAKADPNKIKPISGMVIVTSGKPLQAAVLFDDAEHFATTEPALLRLLAASVDTASKAHEATPAGPMSLASGGDKSAEVCLPASWTVTNVAAGALSAKGPHDELLALGFVQPIIDPESAQAKAFAKQAMYKSSPQLKFPSEDELFVTFTNVVNQLRESRKLPAAKFTFVSANKMPAIAGQMQPIEALFDLDLNDGAGMRKASARIDALRMGNAKTPVWMMAIESSSIPVAYAEQEQPMMRPIIASYRVTNVPEYKSIQNGDPGYWDDEKGRWTMGRRNDPMSCAAMSAVAVGLGEVAKSYIVEPATGDGKFAEALLAATPGKFEIRASERAIPSQDY